MAITFNVNEVLEIAADAERSGAAFYRKAAKHAATAETEKMLLDMAVMEDGHEMVFNEMKKNLSDADKETQTFDPDNEAALYLQSVADSHCAEGKKDQANEFTGEESIGEILESALQDEKDAVAFYTSMKALVPSQSGKGKVDTIINEEIGHIVAIKKKLAEIG
jgi:rubrerythrin